MKSIYFGLAAVLVTFVKPSTSLGQAPDNAAIAEVLFQEAQRLIGDGRVSEACAKFVESDRLDPGMGTKLSIADCYEREGKLAAAWALFTEIIPAAQQAKRKDREALAKSRVDALAPRLPKLTVIMDGADAKTVEVVRDGVVIGAATLGVALPVDPGEHVVVARSLGFKTWSTTVTIKERETLEVKIPALEVEPAKEVEAAPPPPAPPPPLPPPVIPSTSALRTGSFISFGVGGVGLVTWAVLGGLSLQKKALADEACPQGTCHKPGDIEVWRDGRSLANGATVALGVGVAGAATGVILLWLDKRPKDRDATKTAKVSSVLDLGPNGVSFAVKGDF